MKSTLFVDMFHPSRYSLDTVFNCINNEFNIRTWPGKPLYEDDVYEPEGDCLRDYSGQLHCETGVRHGRGMQVYEDGSVYDGFWFNDEEHGFGKLAHPNGCIYFGQWADGDKEGLGI